MVRFFLKVLMFLVTVWFGTNAFIAFALWVHGGFSGREIFRTVFVGIWAFGSRRCLGLRIWRVFDD